MWAVDYHLPGKIIAGLPRFTLFKSFEEAAIRCSMLGFKCVKCKFLLCPAKTVDEIWILSPVNGKFIPEEGYDEFAEKYYRKTLGEQYDEFMENHLDWRPKTKQAPMHAL